jgi:hypothetical protein
VTTSFGSTSLAKARNDVSVAISAFAIDSVDGQRA